MQKSYVAKKRIPDSPGVYLFKKGKEVLYIGKATSLKERTKSYFSSDLLTTRGPKIVAMVARAATLSWIETDSVLEALLLESHLIKQYKPEGNTLEKDNTSYNYVIVTNEVFPRVLIVRGRQLALTWSQKDISHTFGPFPRGSDVKIALSIIRKIFPFRDTCTPQTGKPCFNAQIGLCPGVCVGAISDVAYGETIKHIVNLFTGRKRSLCDQLTKDMKRAVLREDFEAAQLIKRQLHALNHINDVALIKSDVARLSTGGDIVKRIEAYDVAHMSGDAGYGVMVVSENGFFQKDAYRLFSLPQKNNDVASLDLILRRRFAHTEWRMPDIIVVDGGAQQLSVASSIISSMHLNTKVVSVVKDERHVARDILGAQLTKEESDACIALNAEAHRFAITQHRRTLRKKFLSQ